MHTRMVHNHSPGRSTLPASLPIHRDMCSPRSVCSRPFLECQKALQTDEPEKSQPQQCTYLHILDLKALDVEVIQT